MQREGMEAFVARVAAAVPLPGGGSVAALTGTLAAALGEMMAGLTERSEKFASVQLQVADIHAKLTECRSVLRALVQEDSAAYQALLTAIRLPRETEEQTGCPRRCCRTSPSGRDRDSAANGTRCF